jgi:Trk K+ transport system NAD-binding subunit
MPPPPGLRERVVRSARVHLSFLRVLLRQFRVSLGLFVVVVAAGGLVVWHEDGRVSLAHAVYTALTLTFFEVTESYPEGKGVPLQVLYFALPAVGLTLIAEGLVRFGVAVFHRRRMSEEWHMALASTLKDHVVIAGLGHVGRRVALQLCRHERLVCIEVGPPKEGAGAQGLPEDVAVLHGDAAQPEVLERANVRKARAVLCLTDNDMANLEVAMLARELNPKVRVVLRMFNERLGARLVEQFKFDAVYSTSALAAPSFVSALYHSRVLQTIQLGQGREVHMAAFEVAEASPLAGHTILEIERLSGASVVLHQTSGKEDLLPASDARVAAGDQLYVLCQLPKIDAFAALAAGDEG